MAKQAIPFCSFGGYRPFCAYWWRDLARWLWSGWLWDLRTYWHRARYGWAPKDTWGLDGYLDGVLGGALTHLAEHHCGAPFGYPNLSPTSMDAETDFEAWKADLHRWGQAFANNARDDYYELYGKDAGYERWHADEKQRLEARDAALREMLPWWSGLWD